MTTEPKIVELSSRMSRLHALTDSDLEAWPSVEELGNQYITAVLEAAGGNKSKAARVLGFDRRTLYRRLDRASRR